MAEWKKNVARLGRDFRLNRHQILMILRATEKKYRDCKIPMYFKGNREDFLYDKARIEIINRACV